MKTFDFINIYYALPEPVRQSCTGFASIWKVEADNRYCPSQKNGFPHHGIFITYEGSGVISLPEIKRTESLNQSSFFYLPSSTRCSYRCEKQSSWKFFFISFNKKILLNELEYPLDDVMNIIFINKVMQYCNDIIYTILDKKTGYQREADLLFQQLLIQLKKDNNTIETENGKTLTALIRWIHENQNTTVGIKELLSFSGLSRSVLFRLFKYRTGKSPGQYIQDLKFDNAKNILLHTTLNVREIAFFLGFHDEFYFSRKFKEKYGISPSKFRKEKYSAVQKFL